MTQFVAEFTTNHMGNFNVLMEMAKKAKEAGADYIKMQKKDVETYYSKEKLDRFYLSPYGKTYRDYRKIFEFSGADFDIFDTYCTEDLGIKWFSTVQDIPSLEFMLEYKLPKYKIASSSARDYEFLVELRKQVPKRSEIVISVGGSTLQEIDKVLTTLGSRKIVLQHCVAEYPVGMNNLRLGNIAKLKSEFETTKIKIGYSGHEIGIIPSVVVCKEFKPALLERHFCLSRHSFVHHIACSLEPTEFKQMIEEVKNKDINYNLPGVVFSEHFGMSDIEQEFLVKQTYGDRYIGSLSEWKK